MDLLDMNGRVQVECRLDHLDTSENGFSRFLIGDDDAFGVLPKLPDHFNSNPMYGIPLWEMRWGVERGSRDDGVYVGGNGAAQTYRKEGKDCSSRLG